MLVSIIIKALNEERNIARAVESALAALAADDRLADAGEVILADSGSTDGTLAIAARYPISIVQLTNGKDRSCGAGPQLGFQYATGEFVCLIDGDMALDPCFLRDACAFLAANPGVAGVGGFVREKNIVNLEFQRRQKRGARDLLPGTVDRLNGGGVYRRAAIESVGHFSDRNLHGYEEFDLGVRLRAAGWTLHRLAVPFVDHYGHVIGGYLLLWRRFRSRYLYGVGEVLRGSIGQPHFKMTLAALPEIRLWLGVYLGWILIFVTFLAAPSAAIGALVVAVLILCPLAALSLRYRSLSLGAYAVVAWNAHAVGMALGFMRPRVPPGKWIDSETVDRGALLAKLSNAPTPAENTRTSTQSDRSQAARSGAGVLLCLLILAGASPVRPAAGETRTPPLPPRAAMPSAGADVDPRHV